MKRPSSAVADAGGGTILATGDVGMSPERVYRALISTEVERWWGAEGVYWQRQWTADAQVGGQWRVVTVLPDGTQLWAHGTFLELKPPHKIVITRTYEFDYPQLGQRDTTVTYRMDLISGGTRVTVRHEGFAGLAQAAEQHADGWERVLSWLDAYSEQGGAEQTNAESTRGEAR